MTPSTLLAISKASEYEQNQWGVDDDMIANGERLLEYLGGPVCCKHFSGVGRQRTCRHVTRGLS